jgi:hypothetical protein
MYLIFAGPCNSKIHHCLLSVRLWPRSTHKVRFGSLASRSHATHLPLPGALECLHHTCQSFSRLPLAPNQTDTLLAHLSLQYNRSTRPHSHNINPISVSAMPAIQHILGPQHLLDRQCGVRATRAHHREYRCGKCCTRIDRYHVLSHTDNFYPETTSTAW